MGNRCVTAESSAAGSKLSIQACAFGQTRQTWDILDGNRNIKLSGTNLCVTVPNGDTTLGTELQLATCSTSANQIFPLEVSHILFGSTPLCWNVLGGHTTNGSRIGLYNECVTGHQNEVFTARGQIRGLGQCVDMNGPPADGVPLAMKPCSTAVTQTWEYYW